MLFEKQFVNILSLNKKKNRNKKMILSSETFKKFGYTSENSPNNGHLCIKCDYCGKIFDRKKHHVVQMSLVNNKDSCGDKSCSTKKRKESMLVLHGENCFKEKFLEKAKITCMEKYGVDNPAKLKEFKKRGRSTEEVKEIFAKRNCVFLDNEFKGVHFNHNYRCKCGREAKITLASVLAYDQYCMICGIEKRNKNLMLNPKIDMAGRNRYIPYSKIFFHFLKEGCKLLTPNWENNENALNKTSSNIKLQYICKCGRISETTWKNFSKKSLCSYCKIGRPRTYSLEEIKEFFRKEQFELISKEYKNSKTPLEIKCKNNHITKTTANCFKKTKKCITCLHENKKFIKKIRTKLHKMLSRTLRESGIDKNGKTYDLLGYTPKMLQEHIASHPNWKNVKDINWNLDHIFPIIAFLDYGITNPKIINSLNNLRPISQIENCRKSGKYNKIDFEIWLKKAIINNICETLKARNVNI